MAPRASFTSPARPRRSSDKVADRESVDHLSLFSDDGDAFEDDPINAGGDDDASAEDEFARRQRKRMLRERRKSLSIVSNQDGSVHLAFFNMYLNHIIANP